ncbi:cation diffusion facilitator family transporter [Phenylobacterium sp.]|jgi:cation diffusion facilitator family transporter|uniref:cation diffusion facilitator family transporter n=1 Tax=Phenylobacterium sp. TaxID=1871053 RepID=UPI002E31B4DB|nr:cation diffusion facilitator family transporter [Phenylobacterium sp.]HEX2559846.1 cation diffusion facilitator family transporter [Phenylobacterium sp.]
MTTGILSSLAPAETAALTRRVTMLSVGTAAVLVSLKLAVWLASGSVAVMASMADSALDLAASLATFFAVRYAVAPPDREHRFGHGKAEAFASLIQAGLVFASAALIGREAVERLIDPRPIAQEGWATAVMVVSAVLTLGLVRAQTAVLKKTASVAVAGDRVHYVSDLASNAIALLGIAGAGLLGVSGLDAAAGLIIAALLVWGAVGVFREASDQLMDRELPDEARIRILEVVRQDPRLTHVHQLRTRASGPFIHIQMHVDLDPELSFEAAHKVTDDAERRLVEAFPSADVIIHADPRGRAETHSEPFSDED